ncbi:MAG: indole-3-glycerol phosphate synthase TrpC [Candidatus Erginobacter occultus]|nr:indole-3-glycerol phosphate synthase TrpC [Candidatus Erginobacter occultus]
MNDFIKKVIALKREEVAAAKTAAPLRELRSLISDLPETRDFRGALAGESLALIAEVKRSSPSAGKIAPIADPGRLARLYREGGAAAISVLTESGWFGGSLDDLAMVKAEVDLPVLRKDFIIDPYQLHQSRAAGADAVLLIAELLEPETLADFLGRAEEIGLACLVEAHSGEALKMVLNTPAVIVGINNRDLKTLTVDLETSIRLLPLVPEDRVRVAESGVKTAEDIRRLTVASADAVLVGETLARAEDPTAKIRELLTARYSA